MQTEDADERDGVVGNKPPQSGAPESGLPWGPNRASGRRRWRSLLIAMGVAGLGVALFVSWSWRHERLNQSLLTALEQNDTRAVDGLLKAGADPNASVTDGQGDDFLSWLTDRFMRKSGKPSETALIRGVRHCPDAVPLLLKYGADPEQTAGGGDPLLFALFEATKPEVVQALLDAGAGRAHGASMWIPLANLKGLLKFARARWKAARGGARESALEEVSNYEEKIRILTNWLTPPVKVSPVSPPGTNTISQESPPK